MSLEIRQPALQGRKALVIGQTIYIDGGVSIMA